MPISRDDLKVQAGETAKLQEHKFLVEYAEGWQEPAEDQSRSTQDQYPQVPHAQDSLDVAPSAEQKPTKAWKKSRTWSISNFSTKLTNASLKRFDSERMRFERALRACVRRKSAWALRIPSLQPWGQPRNK
uniref:Uncharacterized protein n=1 Tax=Romanomermis culicivorax TaxID=13658 RepID=A0A915HVL8_ROMCU